MLNQIDIVVIERILVLLATCWLGNWQKRAAEFILGHSESILQAPRQTGKTYVVALIAVAYLICGATVVIAMPTMRQAESIIFRTIAMMMRRIMRVSGIKVLRGYDNKTEKVYTNGGVIRVVSGEQLKDAEHPPEGYTAHVLIIDEGHRSERAVLAVCLPFLTQAKLAGTARVIILGVGGHEESLIEDMKADYASLRITPDEVIAEDTEYGAVFADFRRDLTEIDYEQHIECKAVAPGMRHIFQQPIKLAVIDDPAKWRTYPEQLFFGIDVGHESDRTVVTVMRYRMGFRDWIDTYADIGAFTTRDGTGQDRRIVEFIDGYLYEDQHIAIETNGLGIGLYDVLRADPFYRMQGVQINDDLKRGLIDQLTRDARDGIFRCAREEDAKLLQRLKFEIKPTGKRIYEHSDELSSLLMAYAAMQQVRSM